MSEKPCECPMSHTIKELHDDVTAIKSKIDGDGNGHKGLIRRVDAIDGRQEAMERIMNKVDRLFWTILTAIIISMVVSTLQKTYGPAQAQTVSQSVSTTADGDPSSPVYTTAQVAKLLQVSDREVQDRASKGEIPGAHKEGKAWRFDRAQVDRWIAAPAASAAKADSAADAARDN